MHGGWIEMGWIWTGVRGDLYQQIIDRKAVIRVSEPLNKITSCYNPQ